MPIDEQRPESATEPATPSSEQTAPPPPPREVFAVEEARKGIIVMPVDTAEQINIVDHMGGLPAPESAPGHVPTSQPVDASPDATGGAQIAPSSERGE